MPDQIAPIAAPPSSSRPAVTPLSPQEFQAELSRGGAPAPTPPAAPAPKAPEPGVTQTVTPPVPVSPKDSQDPDQQRKSEVPDFKDALRKRVLEKLPDAPKPKEEPPKPKEEPPKPKEEPKPKEGEKPPAKPAEPDPEEIPEEQRKVLPHDKPDTAKRIKYFLKAIETKQAEIDALRKAPKTEANAEELAQLKTEREQLQKEVAQARRRWDLDKDPEFKTKFDEPIAKAEATIEETLKTRGFTEGTLAAIRAEGGFAEFSRSAKQFPVEVMDPDTGEKTTVMKTAAELAATWLQSLPVADGELVRQAVGRKEALRIERQLAATKAIEEADKYYAGLSQQQQQQQQAAIEAQKKANEEYEKFLTETTAKSDFLKDREIPENATPQEKSEIESWNEFNKQLRDGLKKHPTNAAEYGQLKFDAAEAHHLRRMMGAKDAEIAALKEQLAKTKSAVRTTSKSGSILKAPAGDDTTPKPESPTDFKTALRKRIMGGQQDAGE